MATVEFGGSLRAHRLGGGQILCVLDRIWCLTLVPVLFLVDWLGGCSCGFQAVNGVLRARWLEGRLT